MQNDINFGTEFGKNFLSRRKYIDSAAAMEEAVLYFGMLPFFHNSVRGFSIAEMAAPGMLFGGNEGYEGCWEWKGPVIQQQSAAYGKFFRRKAGFVSLELFPHFLNFRRASYPVISGSTEEMLLEIIRENQGITSTFLRKLINQAHAEMGSESRVKRSSLESPLQRLQMGGWLLIEDFEYKTTKRGEPYGWGVAKYSTPELWFGNIEKVMVTPQESFNYLIEEISKRIPGVSSEKLSALLK